MHSHSQGMRSLHTIPKCCEQNLIVGRGDNSIYLCHGRMQDCSIIRKCPHPVRFKRRFGNVSKQGSCDWHNVSALQPLSGIG